ncbi:MAG: hypothetical protein WC328_03640 [Kiritimatiellia bacterium]|nr:hypothetical protein [Kiritimatiellia bacterium]
MKTKALPYTVYIADRPPRKSFVDLKKLPEPHSEDTVHTKEDAVRMLFFYRHCNTHDLAWYTCPEAYPEILGINSTPFYADKNNLPADQRSLLEKELKEDAGLNKAIDKLAKALDDLKKVQKRIDAARARIQAQPQPGVK